ncbi:MAG: NAD(P)/FAD-dependent oxidoreductase [Halobacteriaceae archaeon]
MPPKVVVLGAGYAGASAIQSLEDNLDGVDLTWISDTDYHFVLHESHRVIRDPSVKEKITIPIGDIKSRSTKFVQAEVTDVETDEQSVVLDDGSSVDYDYLLLCVGSETAFFGIEGLEEHALTLKSLDDALEIHDSVREAAADASHDDPAQVVVGGAGLSGIQSAGEIAAYRDKHGAPIDIHLVEGLDNVFPPGEPDLQGRLRKLLENHHVNIMTGEFIGEVDDDTVYVGDETELDYDVLLWTGGITGRDVAANTDLDKDERSNRIEAGADFRTSDDRVFAVGDTALVEQGDGETAPPTAVAAWEAGEAAGENVARAIGGKPLKTWSYEDKGTLISVGDEAVAHDVKLPPGIRVPVDTFGGASAETLKKAAAARWIAAVSSYGRAMDAWSVL